MDYPQGTGILPHSRRCALCTVMYTRTAHELRQRGAYDEARRATREGTVLKLRPSLYAFEAADATPEEKHLPVAQAAIELSSRGAALSHVSAAVLHGLPVHQSLVNHAWVTHPVRRGGGHRRPWLHTVGARLDDGDVVMLNGLPVTSLERTAYDLARHLPAKHALPVLDAVLARADDPEEYREVLWQGIANRAHWPGNADARWLVEFADARAESWGESVSRLIFFEEGLPTPRLQVEIEVAPGYVVRLDFLWDDWSVAGECDGLSKYDDRMATSTPAMELQRIQNRDELLKERHIWTVHWSPRSFAYPKTLAQRILRARH